MEHGFAFYFLPWWLALASALGTLFLVTHTWFLQKRVARHEDGREFPMPRYRRLGGLTIAIVFLIFLFADQRLAWSSPFLALLVGVPAIILFSLADDLQHVSWPWHLSFHAALGLLVFVSGMRFNLHAYWEHLPTVVGPLAGFICTIAWVILVVNAINWADGTDGLMPGIALISFGTIFLLALRPEVNQPTIAILTAVLSGLALGLLCFNWYPARIYSGTGGAYFFGFTLAVLALYAGMKVATILLVLAVPICDALLVVLRRVSLGRSPFLPDREHLHHLLLSRGWHPTMVGMAYLFATGLMALLALSLEGEDKAVVFLITGVLLALFSAGLHISLRSEQGIDRLT